MRLRTWVTGALSGAVLVAVAAALPGQANATPINGTATLNDEGITLNNGTDLSNTTSLTVASFRLVAETGNITLPLFSTQPGSTFDLTKLSSFALGTSSTPVDFTAASGTIVTQNANFLNILYSGTASVLGLDDTKGTLSVTFTDNSGTLGGSNVVAAFTPVPEPATLALFATGLLGLGMVRRRRV